MPLLVAKEEITRLGGTVPSFEPYSKIDDMDDLIFDNPYLENIGVQMKILVSHSYMKSVFDVEKKIETK